MVLCMILQSTRVFFAIDFDGGGGGRWWSRV